MRCDEANVSEPFRTKGISDSSAWEFMIADYFGFRAAFLYFGKAMGVA